MRISDCSSDVCSSDLSLGHGPGSLLSFNRLRGDLPRIFSAILAPQADLVDLFAAELGQRVARHPDLARHLVGREARAEEGGPIACGHGAAGLHPHDRADAQLGRAHVCTPVNYTHYASPYLLA